jgi:hypothetical protein
LRNGYPAQHLAHGNARNALLGGVQQEPTDERCPQAAQVELGREEGLVKSVEDEHVCHQLPYEPGDLRCATEVVIEAPDYRAQHPPAVEREARYHIEQAQQQVDECQVLQDCRCVSPRLAHRRSDHLQ